MLAVNMSARCRITSLPVFLEASAARVGDARCKAMRTSLRLGTSFLLLQQRPQLVVLDSDALGGALLVRGARLRRRLLHELADIVAQDGDAVGKLGVGQGIEIGHATGLLKKTLPP